MAKRAPATILIEHGDTVDELVQKLGDYNASNVNQGHVARWIGQFDELNEHLACRIASRIQYFSAARSGNMFRSAFDQVTDKCNSMGLALNRQFYVAVGDVGASGGAMLHLFRNVNGLGNAVGRILALPDLWSLRFTGTESLVLIDDIVATGDQFVDWYTNDVAPMLPTDLPVLYAAVASSIDAATRILTDTGVAVYSGYSITAQDELLNDPGPCESDADRQTVTTMCHDIGNGPMGHGERGLLVSFAHGSPDNCPSIIRGSSRQRPFKGLLPGYRDL